MALTNDKILETMIERATNPSDRNVDELAVQIFCVTVRNDPSLIPKAHLLIVSKIQSSNISQSLRALSLLEECMSKCGSTFQDEVSKFRFLNDLIRLVSKKYQGDKTPTILREKIMDCLLLWTTEYPSKTKIREAYDLLRKEGFDHTPVTTPVKRDNIMGIDEEKFRKLLQSGNAEDLKRANLLIQSRVNQDARRMELVCRHKTEIEEIQNTVALLNQMLDSFEKNKGDEEGGSLGLIKELHESCENYVPIMERLPELIDNTNEDLIAETFEINDNLHAVIERYKSVVLSNDSSNSSKASPKSQTHTTAPAVASDLLSGLLAQPINPAASKPAESRNLNPLDELTEIFGKYNDNSTSTIPRSMYDSLDLLEPIAITEPEKQPQPQATESTSQKYDFSRLKDIDILSEELIKENLKTSERVISFKKEPERITLNEMVKEKTYGGVGKPTPLSSPEKSGLDGPVDNSSPNEVIQTDVQQVDANDSLEKNSKESLGEELHQEKSDEIMTKGKGLPVVHLADIDVDLDDVSPTREKLLLDDDIKVVLNFTSNRPSPNVSVIVVSVTNQSKLPVTSFQFDASVRKPSKVRLLPATGDSMPGVKPFRPPTPINQVLLLLNPTKAAVDVTCIVGYKLGDDPDPIKESIVAKSIAYVD